MLNWFCLCIFMRFGGKNAQKREKKRSFTGMNHQCNILIIDALHTYNNRG